MTDNMITGIIGITGTIMGAVVTTVMNNWSKNRGKLRLYFSESELTYYGQDEIGQYLPVEEQNAQYACFFVAVQIYNGSDSLKIIKDVVFEIKSACGSTTRVPLDKRTETRMEYGYRSLPLTSENLLPKHIVEIPLTIYIGEKDLDYARTLNRIYFTAHDHKNKQIKVEIK